MIGTERYISCASQKSKDKGLRRNLNIYTIMVYCFRSIKSNDCLLRLTNARTWVGVMDVRVIIDHGSDWWPAVGRQR